MPVADAKRIDAPVVARSFKCQCGRPIFFRNSICLGCERILGYDPERALLFPLAAADGDAVWQPSDPALGKARYLRCAHHASAAGCNWLLAADDPYAGSPALCRCCRLTRTLPDLSIEPHAQWWHRIEQAKRRLVSALIALALPVQSKIEDPQRGLVFDLLRAAPGGPPVVTGHADGVITLDIEEADDAWREQRRTALGEAYRTLLGHLRHESGHYYWQRLVEPGPWLGPYRDLFGDEREDYAAALARHHQHGPPADWSSRFVSAYASCHPWEDWAETWAHYLHLRDTLDTARSFGLDGRHVELDYEPFAPELITWQSDGIDDDFPQLVDSWMELTGVLNELSRSIGVADFYPFVLSAPALRKLHLVHRLIRGDEP